MSTSKKPSAENSPEKSRATTKAEKVKAAVERKLPPDTASPPTGRKPPEHAGNPAQTNPSNQIAAEAEAKQARVDESGLTSRTRGHVSARTRRDQAKRDQG